MKQLKYRQMPGFNGLLMVALFFFALLLSGCNDSSTDASSDEGELYISLTDAEGDFSSYTVDVTAISLLKADGTVVETLPLTTRVDFAQYVEMTEFLSAVTIPAGLYVKGTLTLDYRNADIWVEDSSGVPVQVRPENLLDESGNPISSMDLSVRLEEHNSLLIVPGLPSHLTLDFDLAASHQTDFTSGEPVVSVKPVLVADIDLQINKPHRVRGPLQSVDLADSSYQIFLRPFHHKVSNNNSGRFGELTINTTDETIFQIDGEMYKGERGLQMLALKERFTATIAIGDLKFNPRQFEAREVYAGSSVPGGVHDVVKGSVIARDGDLLTVRGTALTRADGAVDFNREIVVTIGPDTKVRKQLSVESHDTSLISIGAQVTIFGEFTPSITTIRALDATQGLVHLKLSTIRGTVADNSRGLVMDLSAIDRRRVAQFDFAGTGRSAELDADPSNYELETAMLDVTQFGLNEPVAARGFATPFGSAPADFEAQTVVSLSARPAVIVVDWQPASATAISQMDSGGIVLSLDGVGRFHHVSQGGSRINLVELEQAPTLLPGETGLSHYVIKQHDSYHLFLDFDEFIAELRSKLDGGAVVKRVVAPGMYSSSETSLTARRINIVLE